MFYVYVYLDPQKSGSFDYGELHFDYEPFYVGKGKEKRDRWHLQETVRTTSNPHKYRRIQNIKLAGLTPIILRLQDGMSEVEAWNYEKTVIEKIGRRTLKTGPLTNIQEGGQGGACTGDSKQRMIEKHMGKNVGVDNPRYGKSTYQILLEKYGQVEGEKRYTEYLEKQRLQTRQRWTNNEYRQRLRDAHKGLLVGEKNPMHGTSTHEQMLKKYGVEEGERKYEEYRQRIRNGKKKQKESGWVSPTKGRSRAPISEETRQRQKDAQRRRREREAIESH